jgi:hypothetical protein
MTGQLLFQPVIRAVDDNGLPLSGAQLRFYETGTTTPTPVYSNDCLETPLANPVVADSGGLFAPIFLDPSVTYRAQLLDGTGALISDMDPINGPVAIADGAVTAAMLAAGAVAGSLGYTPLNKGGDTATNLTLAFSAYAANSAGYLGAPINEQDASYAFAAADAGKMVRADITAAATYTLNARVFPASGGAAILVRNSPTSTASLSIAPGSGVSIYGAGGTTTKTWTLAPGGLATLIMETTSATNLWVISGAGLS